MNRVHPRSEEDIMDQNKGCKLERIDNGLGRAFSKYGMFLYDHRIIFLCVSIFVSSALGFGLLAMKYEQDIETLYTPKGSQASHDRQIVTETFPLKSDSLFYPYKLPNTGRFGSIIFEDGEYFTGQTLDSIRNLTSYLMKISIQLHGSNYKYKDLCASRENSCVVAGNYLTTPQFKSAYLAGNVSFPLYTDHNGEQHDLRLNTAEQTVQNGSLFKMKAIRLTFYLRTESKEDDSNAQKWEDAFLNVMAKRSLESSDFAYEVSRSMNNELDKNTAGDTIWISLTFTAMITYVSVVSEEGGCFSARANLARFGVIAVALAIIASFGLLCACGLKFVNIVGVVPFLVLGKGIDDMFILLAGLSNELGPPRDQIGKMFESSATAITVTTLTDVVAFGVGASSSYISIRNFCIYTGMTLLFCYINMITMFSALVAIYYAHYEKSITNAADKPELTRGATATGRDGPERGDVQDTRSTEVSMEGLGVNCGNISNPHVSEVGIDGIMPDGTDIPPPDQLGSRIEQQSKKRPSNPKVNCLCKNNLPGYNQKGCGFENKFVEVFQKIVVNKIIWPIILVVFLVLLGFSIWATTQMKEGLDLKNLAEEGSYWHKFASWNSKFFSSRGPVIQIVVTEPMNYWESGTEHNVRNLVNEAQATRYILSDFSVTWVQSFRQYLNITGRSNAKRDTYLKILRKEFLPLFPVFENDLLFSQDNRSILSSRIYIQGAGGDDSKFQGDMMVSIRDVMSASDLPVFAFSAPFIFFEQYVTILPNTLQTCGVAIAAMFLIALIFIPHPLSAVYITVTMMMILVNMLGFMHLWGLTLSSITMIQIILSIGFSVDFSSHICHAFMAVKDGTRSTRAKKALIKVAVPIFNGALSSLLGVLFLAFANSYVFQSFFKVMFLVVLFGVMHALFLLPAVLSIIGPGHRCS